MKKNVKSLAVSKKYMETSMLAYSKKMRNISEQRETMKLITADRAFHRNHQSNNSNKNNDSSSAVTANANHSSQATSSSKDNYSSHSTSTKKWAHKRIASLPPLSLQDGIDNSSKSNEDVTSLSVRSLPSSFPLEIRGRVSVDSGLGLDSDSCVSDNESISRSSRFAKGSSVTSDDSSYQSESLSSPERHSVGQRGQKTKRRRFRCLNNYLELETVPDVENVVSENPSQDKDRLNNPKIDQDESVTIIPFPENIGRGSISSRLESISELGDDDELTKTRILNPLRSPPLRYKHNTSPKPKKKTKHVLTKPKAAHSPSIASMKMRFQRLANRRSSKPSRHTFKYSYAVETALRSLNSSPEGRKETCSPTMSPELPGLDLNELLNEVIQRPNDRDILEPEESEEELEIFKPHRLFRERSFSEPIANIGKPLAFVSSLEKVQEDDDTELRSVLKKSSVQYPADKKSVQFFLPDIFLTANACTSNPTSLR